MLAPDDGDLAAAIKAAYRTGPSSYPFSSATLAVPGLRASAGALAQLGEHLLCKQGVVGSIPTGSTRLRVLPDGSVAQVVRAYA